MIGYCLDDALIAFLKDSENESQTDPKHFLGYSNYDASKLICLCRFAMLDFFMVVWYLWYFWYFHVEGHMNEVVRAVG